MLDELLLEGIGPSPEAVKRWEEKRAAASRSCSPPHPPAPLTVEEELALERQKVEALEAKLEASRLETDAWIAAASSLVNMLFLSPSQNANHAASVFAGLESAISKLGFVKELRYCDCSFPVSDASKPKIVLRRWTSLEDSEWDLAWTPAWTCEACIDGQRGITFSTLMKVSGIAMAGRLAISFATDFSAVRVRFTETPTVHLDVACHVTLGDDIFCPYTSTPSWSIAYSAARFSPSMSASSISRSTASWWILRCKCKFKCKCTCKRGGSCAANVHVHVHVNVVDRALQMYM